MVLQSHMLPTNEEAAESIQAGTFYDPFLLGGEFTPPLVEKGLLKPMKYCNIPNFKDISANFREAWKLFLDGDNEP